MVHAVVVHVMGFHPSSPSGTEGSVMGYGAYSWLSDQFGPSSPSTLNLK